MQENRHFAFGLNILSAVSPKSLNICFTEVTARNMASNTRKWFASKPKSQFGQLGENVTIDENAHIEHPEHVRLDDNVKLNAGARLLTLKAKRDLPAGKITIGKSTLISFNSTVFAGRGTITIGEYTEVGLNCAIVAQKRVASRKEKPGADGTEWFSTEIGDECLFGTGAMVLEGSKLGNRCVVGAGAVVQGTYPDDTVLIGNPARPIPGIKK